MLTELTRFKNKYAGTFHGKYPYTSAGFGQIHTVYQSEFHGFTDAQLSSSSTAGRLHITSMTMTNTSDHTYFVNVYAQASSSTMKFSVYPGATLHANSTLQLCNPQTPKSLVVVSPFQYVFRFQAMTINPSLNQDYIYTAGDVTYSVNWVLETEL